VAVAATLHETEVNAEMLSALYGVSYRGLIGSCCDKCSVLVGGSAF
jgi:hypothetical protein